MTALQKPIYEEKFVLKSQPKVSQLPADRQRQIPKKSGRNNNSKKRLEDYNQNEQEHPQHVHKVHLNHNYHHNQNYISPRIKKGHHLMPVEPEINQ